MDVENENILKTIFKESFPEEWRENEDFAQYLAELSAQGIEKLSKEPDNLMEEKSIVLEQTQELAFNNYKTFIQTAECSKQIYEDFNVIKQRLGSLVQKMPSFVGKCEEFSQQLRDIFARRRMNTFTLSKYSQILEILELPQLMDTCVRNGYYDEALELSNYVKRLDRKHGSIQIIGNIVQEVQNCRNLMLNQLLGQLRSNIQLPACLKVVSYLRRMEVFTEAQLRIKFLQVRDSWFQSVLRAIPNTEPYYHITKTIEASRVHLFDIITQYRAIFSDDDQVLFSHRDSTINESAIFHNWVLHKVNQFLMVLETDLERGVGGRLDSLLGQCMYFGLSFSRVGADFRNLLIPLFQKAALNGLKNSISRATTRFEEGMQSYTLTVPPTVLVSSVLATTTAGQVQQLISDDKLHPPLTLLEFSPLAQYCNNLLIALNELRLCVPLSLASQVTRCLQESLEKASEAIVEYYRAEEAMFSSSEREMFFRLCTQFTKALVPYMDQCLEAMFSPHQLSELLGSSVTEVAKMEYIGSLNQAVIIKQLEVLFPSSQKDEEVPLAHVLQEDDVETDVKAFVLQEVKDKNIEEKFQESSIPEDGGDHSLTKE